jgi:hypothetical protein
MLRKEHNRGRPGPDALPPQRLERRHHIGPGSPPRLPLQSSLPEIRREAAGQRQHRPWPARPRPSPDRARPKPPAASPQAAAEHLCRSISLLKHRPSGPDVQPPSAAAVSPTREKPPQCREETAPAATGSARALPGGVHRRRQGRRWWYV